MNVVSEVSLCPHCGAKMVEYPHTLSQQLVLSLCKLDAAGGVANLNDLPLTRPQEKNFQKLRYFCAVRKVGITGAGSSSGVWELTRSGREFLLGDMPLYPKVWTYRAEAQRYEGKPVWVTEFDGLPSRYKRREDYAAEAEPHEEE
jgi:hypothetical protein